MAVAALVGLAHAAGARAYPDCGFPPIGDVVVHVGDTVRCKPRFQYRIGQYATGLPLLSKVTRIGSSDPALLRVENDSTLRAAAAGKPEVVASLLWLSSGREVVIEPAVARVRLIVSDTAPQVGDTLRVRMVALAADGSILTRVPMLVERQVDAGILYLPPSPIRLTAPGSLMLVGSAGSASPARDTVVVRVLPRVR
jgi:hypothetical protein